MVFHSNFSLCYQVPSTKSESYRRILEVFLCVKHMQYLFISIRIPYKGEFCSFLFQLIEFKSRSRAAVCDLPQSESLAMKGVSEKMLRGQFVGFGTNAAAAHLCEKIKPKLTVLNGIRKL